MTTQFTAAQLKQVAAAARLKAGCDRCLALVCPGWESLPSDFDPAALATLGTLRDGSDEPTWEEFHPQGTRTGSPLAPIAVGYFPYNRCDVLACVACGRAFLRYTETGGYYVDVRIRELIADLVVTA